MLAKRTALRPFPTLRRMVSAGEPLEPETIAAFREAMGLEPADGYGQTETGHVTGNLSGRAGPTRLDGQAAAGDRDPDPRWRAAVQGRIYPNLLLPLPRRRAL